MIYFIYFRFSLTSYSPWLLGRKLSLSFRERSPDNHTQFENLYPFSDQNGSKTIPSGVAHTYIPYIGEYPPGPGGQMMGYCSSFC